MVLARTHSVAAVALVIPAAFMVVCIITESVTQVAVDTSSSCVGGVLALTVLAVCGDHVLSAAVTIVPVATSFVVTVITSAVTLVLWQFTGTLDVAAIGVIALAVFAKRELVFHVSFAIIVVTAIAAIPVAVLHVVLIVAVTVTRELVLAFVVSVILAVATVASALEDVLEHATSDLLVFHPVGTSSSITGVLRALLDLFVQAAFTTAALATVSLFEAGTREPRLFAPVVARVAFARFFAHPRLFWVFGLRGGFLGPVRLVGVGVGVGVALTAPHFEEVSSAIRDFAPRFMLLKV